MKLLSWPTASERATLYNHRFPDYPPLVVSGRWLYGTWMLGQNYQGSGYYGAFPPTFLKRVSALFPEIGSGRVLHLCSGSLDEDVYGVRLDINPALNPTVCGDAMHLPFRPRAFDLVVADIPYGPVHAKRYGTKMPVRPRVFRQMAQVVKPGGHVAWLDIKHPMYSKEQWQLWGTIQIIRSTNHDYRGLTLFQRL